MHESVGDVVKRNHTMNLVKNLQVIITKLAKNVSRKNIRQVDVVMDDNILNALTAKEAVYVNIS
jgi:hypothetical protein